MVKLWPKNYFFGPNLVVERYQFRKRKTAGRTLDLWRIIKASYPEYMPYDFQAQSLLAMVSLVDVTEEPAIFWITQNNTLQHGILGIQPWDPWKPIQCGDSVLPGLAWRYESWLKDCLCGKKSVGTPGNQGELTVMRLTMYRKSISNWVRSSFDFSNVFIFCWSLNTCQSTSLRWWFGKVKGSWVSDIEGSGKG